MAAWDRTADHNYIGAAILPAALNLSRKTRSCPAEEAWMVA